MVTDALLALVATRSDLTALYLVSFRVEESLSIAGSKMLSIVRRDITIYRRVEDLVQPAS